MEMETKAGDAKAMHAKTHSGSAPAATEPDRKRPTPVMLALQGGGSHSAFTWGVLDYLLERQEAGDIEITAISGTSGGAMNAALVAYGLQSSPAEARMRLHDFWLKNSIAAALSFNPLCIPMPIFGSWNLDYYPWIILLNSLGLVFSPYQKAPGANLLAQAISSCVDFDALNELPGPKVFVLATNARTGRWKTFEKGTMSVDAVLASACIPTVFPAIMFGGDPHWDGGYLKDPGLFPLINYKESSGNDILIIGVNPFKRPAPYLPLSAWEIADRLNELSFNSSLMAEVEKVLLVNDGLSQGVEISAHKAESPPQKDIAMGPKKPFSMHYLEPHIEMAALGVASKSNGSYPFVRYLFGLGRQAAAGWWPKCADNLGRRDTDLHKIVGRKQVEQPTGSGPGSYQAAQHFIDRLMGSLPRHWSMFPPASETTESETRQ